MDLISISTTTTGFQLILFLIGGLALIMTVISLTVFFIEFDGNISKQKQVIATTLIFASLAGISLGLYQKTEELILYHYVVRDFNELDEMLEIYEIYSNENNVHKLIRK